MEKSTKISTAKKLLAVAALLIGAKEVETIVSPDPVSALSCPGTGVLCGYSPTDAMYYYKGSNY